MTPELPFMFLKPGTFEALDGCLRAFRKKCEKIAKPAGCFSELWGFLFETGLGTLDQMRIELENNFSTKRLTIPVAKNASIDAMVVLPVVEGEKPRDRDLRLRAFEHQLEDREASLSRDASLRHSKLGLRPNDSAVHLEAVNLAVICQPNSHPYEMSFYEQSILKFFLENNVHVFLWNYRGYGKSTGSPSLENIAQDAETLVRWLKEKLAIRSLVVYGRSLGGHAAKSVSHLCDLVILDRTFSSVSLVANYALQPLAQRLFDAFIDNYRINCRPLLETESKKIVLYDPKNDQVVRYFASLTFGLTAEFTNLFFNKSARVDLESLHSGSEFLRLFRRLRNIGFQKEFHQKQLKVVRLFKLLLNERDSRVLFFALRRIVRACFARAENDRAPQPRAQTQPPEFDLERLASEEGAEMLDEETLASLHQANTAQSDKMLEDPAFDYSGLVHSQVEKESCFKAIDKVAPPDPDFHRALVRRSRRPDPARGLPLQARPAGAGVPRRPR